MNLISLKKEVFSEVFNLDTPSPLESSENSTNFPKTSFENLTLNSFYGPYNIFPSQYIYAIFLF